MKLKYDDFFKTIGEYHSFSFIIAQLKFAAFRKLTKKSTDLFLRGKDVISVSPLITGKHDPELTNLITTFANSGYNDFLIDIGANIGLISCQSGAHFREVHMYEPNPLCCHILAVNTKLALTRPLFEIHPFGLGSEEKKVVLTVPKHNWGGAFVNDGSNSYDENTLAGKDGFKNLFSENYFTTDIEIRDATTELQSLFRNLSQKNLKKGVVKVDVEGFELQVLRGIARALPSSCSIYIVFESWGNDFPIDEVRAEFNRDIYVGKITHAWPWKKNWPRLLKALSLLLPRTIKSKISPATTGGWKGDIVLLVL